MTKRIITCLLLLAMAFAFSACGTAQERTRHVNRSTLDAGRFRRQDRCDKRYSPWD